MTWAEALDEFESRLGLIAEAAESGAELQLEEWSFPAEPIPSDLTERARQLMQRGEEQATHIEQRRDAVLQQITAGLDTGREGRARGESRLLDQRA